MIRPCGRCGGIGTIDDAFPDPDRAPLDPLDAAVLEAAEAWRKASNAHAGTRPGTYAERTAWLTVDAAYSTLYVAVEARAKARGLK